LLSDNILAHDLLKKVAYNFTFYKYKFLFRLRRRISPDLYPLQIRDYHDLVVEFSIDL